MKKRILFAVAVILLLIAAYLFYQTRPGGDINDFEEYFVAEGAQPNDSTVTATFFGVSTLLFDDGETQILIDGFFSRPSMWLALTGNFGSDTAAIDNLVTTYNMSRVKGVFVTHSHYDHSLDAAYVTRRTGATLYGSVSTLNIGRGGDVKEEQLVLFKPDENVQLGKFTVHVIPSKHSPGNALNDDGVVIDKPIRQPVTMKDYPEGGSYDFLLAHSGKSIFIKPSPNFIEGVLDSLRADFVFIGIATVSKQTDEWQNQYYDQTIGKLKPSVVVPLHWDDFFVPMSDELVMLPRFVKGSSEDLDFFISRTTADNIDFKILQGTRSMFLFNQQDPNQ